MGTRTVGRPKDRRKTRTMEDKDKRRKEDQDRAGQRTRGEK